jgi:hypothetical protein
MLFLIVELMLWDLWQEFKAWRRRQFTPEVDGWHQS